MLTPWKNQSYAGSTASRPCNERKDGAPLAGMDDEDQEQRLSHPPYVRFGSTSAGNSYQDDTAVRNVRLAVQSASFTGMNGTFTVSVTDTSGEERRVRVHLLAINEELSCLRR